MSSSSSTANSSDNYSQLDELGTQLFMPRTRRFDLLSNDVEGKTNIRVPMVDGERMFVSHPGGVVFFLRESSVDPSSPLEKHFASVFAAPSIVTLSAYDVHHLKIDCTNEGTSAHWPGYEALSSCPVCRAKAVPDATTTRRRPLIFSAFQIDRFKPLFKIAVDSVRGIEKSLKWINLSNI